MIEENWKKMNKDNLMNQEINLLEVKESPTNILPLFPEKVEQPLSLQDALKNLNINLKKIFDDKPQKCHLYLGVIIPFKKDK